MTSMDDEKNTFDPTAVIGMDTDDSAFTADDALDALHDDWGALGDLVMASNEHEQVITSLCDHVLRYVYGVQDWGDDLLNRFDYEAVKGYEVIMNGEDYEYIWTDAVAEAVERYQDAVETAELANPGLERNTLIEM